MKLTAISTLALLMLSACGGNGNDNAVTDDYTPGTDSVRDSLERALADQDSVIALMTEISDAMQQIKAMEGIVSSSDMSSPEIINRREQLRTDMRLIQESIAANRERLAQLEQRLNKSNSNNARLKRAVTSLRNQIAEQEITIASLRSDLAAANIYIEELTQAKDSLTTSVAQAEEATGAARQEATNLANELNRAYYVVGSKKELKDHNIIETGFMKKAKISPEDYELSYFTPVDKRNFTRLNLHSKKAEVMSPQPKDSYTLTDDATGMKVITITNPARFWATTNYLVIKID